MAEILGAISAGSNLFENALSVVRCLRETQRRLKDLDLLLKRHEDELDSIEIILKQLGDEDNSDFHSDGLIAQLVRLQKLHRKLAALLEKLDPGSTPKFNQFARQLLVGAENERKLNSLMDELAQIKTSMILCIQLTIVGVTRESNKQVLVDASKIERIDSNLRQHLAQLKIYKGLRIAELIKGRTRSVDGKVPITEADLQSLYSASDASDSGSDTLVESDLRSDTDVSSFSVPLKLERSIFGNVALHQSFQINCPVGEDVSKHIARLEIRDNVSKNQAAQFNHPISIEAMTAGLTAHGNNMRGMSAPQTRKKKRRDSSREQYGDDGSGRRVDVSWRASRPRALFSLGRK